MISRLDPMRRPKLGLEAAVLFSLALAATLANCTGGTGNDNGSGGGSRPVVAILSPTLNRNLPVGQPITITYTVSSSSTATIDAFYDPDTVFGTDNPDAEANEILIGTDLPTGISQTVTFNTAGVVPGLYNFGIRAENAAGETIQYARASDGSFVTIRVNGRPEPAINSPNSNLEILVNTTASVNVVFSCNDPENDAAWEVFYDTNQTVDGSEVSIRTGSGNNDAGSINSTVQWQTLSVGEGIYSVGVRCTDSAGSAVTAYSDGRVTLTSQLSIPTIMVTEPAEDLLVFADEQVPIKFAASDPTAARASISVFLDRDQDGPDGSEINLAIGLPASATSVPGGVNSSIIPDGVYFVGAALEQDGRQNFDYAPGRLTVSGVGDLTISQPAGPVTVPPGTDVQIAWSTNLPIGAGLIDLELFRSDAEGNLVSAVDPDPLADAKNLEIIPNSRTLDTSTLDSGNYIVQVTLTPVDQNDLPTGDPATVKKSPRIRITTLPSVLWMGSIELTEEQQNDVPLGHFDGIVFEGVQFEDNAGTDLLAVGDVEAFGGQDFVIGARFAKPLFTNPNGIGIGEAYLIYSDDRIVRSNRRFNLNGVGDDVGQANPDSNSLPGLVFFGIRFDRDSEDINGDSQLANGSPGAGCFTEDLDGDGKLDFFDEDLNGNGVLDPFEDRDLDGVLDYREDGVLFFSPNCDGVIANPVPSAGFVVAQYVNGFLDTAVSEDRDGDGILDVVGDSTRGLTSMGLMPDVDNDGNPEIAFGFEFTDSVKPGQPDQRNEPNDFGTLVQPNQFERGGIVIVPTLNNNMVRNRAATGRFNDDRVFELDRAGQEFFDVEQGLSDVGDCCATHDEGGCSVLSIAGCVCEVDPLCCIDADDNDPFFNGWDIVCVIQVESLGCAVCEEPPEDVNSGPGIVGNAPPGRPTDGMDSYPLVADIAGVGAAAATCAAGQTTLALVNNLSTPLVARPNLTTNVDGVIGATTPLIIPSTTTTLCLPCTTTVTVTLGTTSLRDIHFNTQVDLIEAPGSDVDPPDTTAATATVACGDSIVFAFVGPDDPAAADPLYDSFIVCAGSDADPTSTDFCDPDQLGSPQGCDVVTAVNVNAAEDGCDDVMIGPFYGFSYAGLTGVSGSQITFESPSHPLAYDETLSNPAVREREFSVMSTPAACSDCGFLLRNAEAVRDINDSPPFDQIASGFYPGATEATGPIGARILGQAVGDKFGKDISRSPSAAERVVFVSSPARSVGNKAGAGVVYQWRMERYWHLPLVDLSNGLSAVDNFGGIPKPHQYIVKDLGFDTPDHGRIGATEGSLKFANTYTGADAGDNLGAAIIGIADFNGDAQTDLIMGAPGADGATNNVSDAGAVYIIYRRSLTSEGALFDLNLLALSRTNPNRLNGMLINGTSAGDRLGEVLAGNCDLNGDDTMDVVLGIPNANGGMGEVVIVFGSPNPAASYLPSPENGYSISALVDQGHAVRILGAFDDDFAGFNVACNGDFDGDDHDDLLISAPGATPMFDSDGDDVADTPGLDLDRDGVADVDDNGALLLPDPVDSGLLYVITNTADLSGIRNLGEMGGRLQGFIFAGVRGGDQLGGGIESKRQTRSNGLIYAGDIDADGRDDVLVSSILADPNNKTNAGEVYLIHGFTRQDAENFLTPN